MSTRNKIEDIRSGDLLKSNRRDKAVLLVLERRDHNYFTCIVCRPHWISPRFEHWILNSDSDHTLRDDLDRISGVESINDTRQH